MLDTMLCQIEGNSVRNLAISALPSLQTSLCGKYSVQGYPVAMLCPLANISSRPCTLRFATSSSS